MSQKIEGFVDTAHPVLEEESMLNNHANRVNIRSVADDVAHNPMLAEALFANVVRELEGDPAKMRIFALTTAAKGDEQTLKLFEIFGEVAKMVKT